jgi:hypothetical protein
MKEDKRNSQGWIQPQVLKDTHSERIITPAGKAAGKAGPRGQNPGHPLRPPSPLRATPRVLPLLGTLSRARANGQRPWAESRGRREDALHWSKVQYLFSFSSHRVHIIWKQFPMSGMWAIGILLGIKLGFVGLIMLMGGSPVRSVAPTVSRGLTCLPYGYSIPMHEGFPHQTCKGCR